jgi:hypothetical protein
MSCSTDEANVVVMAMKSADVEVGAGRQRRGAVKAG